METYQPQDQDKRGERAFEVAKQWQAQVEEYYKKIQTRLDNMHGSPNEAGRLMLVGALERLGKLSKDFSLFFKYNEKSNLDTEGASGMEDIFKRTKTRVEDEVTNAKVLLGEIDIGDIVPGLKKVEKV